MKNNCSCITQLQKKTALRATERKIGNLSGMVMFSESKKPIAHTTDYKIRIYFGKEEMNIISTSNLEIHKQMKESES
ncbi:hypothetical protein CDAR_31441 [Caerostris darwini]|uniref:Uncharacterized protein n=1 Tax=Caerostris darwini TaxID=1538125 RepID=A0AAV4SY72_9ARAC|nr:hypothetical protein CDAR_31441 [Caerostris darwini]